MQFAVPPPYDRLFQNNIAHPDVFIWDAWSLKKNTELFLYTLATPRDVFKNGALDIQTQRDHVPHHHRLFTSRDQGKTWQDRGGVFAPRLGENKFDSRSIWTGSTVPYKGKIIAGYTGIRQTDNKHPFIQSIGLSVSDDGFSFARLTDEALSCPIRDYSAIRRMGYYLGPQNELGNDIGEEGGAILAWRDPGLIVDVKSGELHAFWSAKAGSAHAQIAVLGHGIIHDPVTSPRLELLAPVLLEDRAEYTQAEVPQLLYSHEKNLYYLSVSTAKRTSNDQKDADLDLAARLYQSASLSGPWQCLDKIITSKDAVYPATLIETVEGEESETIIKFIAPYNRSNDAECMHTMSPMRAVSILNNKISRIIV